MKNVLLFAVGLFFAACAAGDSNFTNVVASGDVTVGDDLVVSDAVTVAGLVNLNGGYETAITTVTGAYSLLPSDCGKIIAVTAGIDTNTMTLPEASTVLGCVYTIVYIGADAGALLDISPLDSDADGIEGGCTLASSVVTFSGTADADIGLTKATGLTGDMIQLAATTSAIWGVTSCKGIWANN